VPRRQEPALGFILTRFPQCFNLFYKKLSLSAFPGTGLAPQPQHVRTNAKKRSCPTGLSRWGMNGSGRS
jgi:hypothetical protein